MKTKLLLFTMFLIGLTCYSQNTYVPDDNFEQFLIDTGIDPGSLDDYVPTANIETIIDLNIISKNISDLTGIEDFRDLNQLWCNNNQLTNLDVSNNNQLFRLHCYNNQLTSLNLSTSNTLLWLRCENNQLTSLDLSQNTALKELSCGTNQLTNLDVSQNTALTALYCDSNQLTSLDVDTNTALTALICDNNLLTTIDVSQNTALYLFYCGVNQLTSLDLTKNTALQFFWCNSNNLSSLDFRNGNNTLIFDFVALTNPNLYCIDVDDAAYSTGMWFNIDTHCSFSENCTSLGTEDFELAGFAMYPNPTFDIVKISINEEASYSIVSLNGQVLKNGKLIAGDNTLRTSQLSNGLYFLNIRTDRGFIFKKLVKR